MSKIKHGGLDQYGPERFGRLILLQSEKRGNEKAKTSSAWSVEAQRHLTFTVESSHYRRSFFSVERLHWIPWLMLPTAVLLRGHRALTGADTVRD